MFPYRYRWCLLLAASCVFYMAFIPIYLLILFSMIVLDYIAGILIEQFEGRKRKLFLTMSLLSNVGVLAFFKYYNFFGGNLTRLAGWIHWHYSTPILAIALPLGLSFHTFQAMSYNIEVYRHKQKAERNLGVFALYVMFYPQLVAGPIERPAHLIHQFYEKYDFDYKRVTDGLKLMLWGLFKKIVIADQIAPIVDKVYNHPVGCEGAVLIMATVLFAFQIYCDFSGYSDIAVGAAQVMGFKLINNFRSPYFSKSVSEFWTRWHISLSLWFRDYLYIPLGGNRVCKWRWYYNLFVVFLVSGLWHGAKWTFVIWGALNGFYILFSLWTAEARNTVCRLVGLAQFPVFHRCLGTLCTFSFICFAWIFFRANSLADAGYITTHIFKGWKECGTFHGLAHSVAAALPGVTKARLTLIACPIILLEFVHGIQQRRSIREVLNCKPIWVRWPVYYVLILSIILSSAEASRQFIYFQF